MPLLEIISGYVLSIFANASYDLIKSSFTNKDNPLFLSLDSAINKAADKFFKQYGSEFGTPEYSFLARQENWDVIIKSLFLGTDVELSPETLNPIGYEGAASASAEAISFFIQTLREEISKDFELNKLVAEKKHIKTTEKILEGISDQKSTLAAIVSCIEENKDNSLAQNEKLNAIPDILKIMEQIRDWLPAPADSKADDDKVDKFINEQIDQYRDLINERKPKTALTFLEGLKERHWEDLSSHTRFRVLTNISAAKISLGQETEGAEGLLEAESLAPTDIKAHCNSTLAYILLGEPKKAMDKALQTIKAHPDNSEAYAMLLVAAAKNDTIIDPLPLLPEGQLESFEVVLQLSEFYRHKNNPKEATRWIRKAFELNPDRTEIRELYAVCLLDEIFSNVAVTYGRQIKPEQLTQLAEARDILNDLWEKGKNSEVVRRFIPCAINLSNVERLLGNSEHSHQILKDAMRLIPDDYQLIRQAAFLAMENGRHDKACALLADIPDQAFEGKLLMEAEALLNINKYPQALEKIDLFIASVTDANPRVITIANALRIRLLKETMGVDAAVTEGEKLAEETADNLDYMITVFQVLYDGGFRDKAKEWAEKAKALIGKQAGYIDISLVADAYFQLDLYQDAATLYKDIVPSDRDTRDLRRYLICLMETDQRREALEKISQLPEDVTKLPFYSKLCAELYNRAGNLPTSQKYLEIYLKAAPEDLRARLSWINLMERMGKTDLVEEFLGSAAKFPNAKSDETVYLSQVLARHRKGKEAVALAYNNLRKFNSVASAHLGYVGLFLGLLKSVPEIDHVVKEQSIEADCAFTVELDSGKRMSFVIEDAPDSGLLEQEIGSAHLIAQKALGLKVGERFVLHEDEIRREESEIVEVKHKYLFALHNSMADFGYRFAGEKGFFGVHLKTGDDGKPDFQFLLNMISQRHDAVLRFENLYRTQPLPIDFMAKHLGVNPIDAWFGLCRSERVKIICCQGTPEERNAAFTLLHARKDGFVIDPITLNSLFILNVHNEILAFSGGRLGITQSTMDLFKGLVDSRRIMSAHASMGKQGEQFYLQEFSEENIEESIKPFEELMEWCKANCEIVPAVGKKALSEQDKRILTCFDAAFIDTLFAAEGSDRLLLSDDHRYRQCAKLMFGIDGVWTQPLLQTAVATGHFSREKYNDAVIHLLDLNYSFIYIMADNLIFQLEENNYEVKGGLSKILAALGSKETEILSAISIAADILLFIWNSYISSSKKEKLTYAILNAVTNITKRDQVGILFLLHSALSRRMVIFNLMDEKTFDDIKATFGQWCSGHFLLGTSIKKGK
jgi:cellulose synthase operon protein C